MKMSIDGEQLAGTMTDALQVRHFPAAREERIQRIPARSHQTSSYLYLYSQRLSRSTEQQVQRDVRQGPSAGLSKPLLPFMPVILVLQALRESAMLANTENMKLQRWR